MRKKTMMQPIYIETFFAAIVGASAIGIYQFLKRSVKREFKAVVEKLITPELNKINKRIDESHKRIDDHMKKEEKEIEALISVLSRLAGVPEKSIKKELEQ